MVHVEFLMSIVPVTLVAVVASAFFVVDFLPRPFFWCRPAFVVIALRLAIPSTIAVSVIWLVVMSVTSVASRSTIGVTTPIVTASALRPARIVSPALALACLATCVIRAARLYHGLKDSCGSK
jgi:hypothetical protein